MTKETLSNDPQLGLLARHYRGDPAKHEATPSAAAKKMGWGKKVFWATIALVNAGTIAMQGIRAVKYVSDVTENYQLQAPASSRAIFEMVSGYRTTAPYNDSWNSVQNRFGVDHQDGGLKVYQLDVSAQDILTARKSSTAEAKRLLAQMDMRQEVQLIKDPLAKLFAIQIYNNLTIQYDLNRSKLDGADQKRSYFPVETYRKGSGICEDWSIATYRSVIASGFDSNHVKIFGMKFHFKDGTTDGHAAVDVNVNGQNYIMNVGLPVLVKADALFAPKSPNLNGGASLSLVDAVGADGVQVYSQTQVGSIKPYASAEDGIVNERAFSPDDRAIIDDIAASAAQIAKLPVYMTPDQSLGIPPYMPKPFRR